MSLGLADTNKIKLVYPKGNQSWIFIGRNDAEAEAPILWLTDVKNWLTGKDADAGKDWRQEEKGTSEIEMVGWHHWLNGHECEQAPGVGDEQGSLACCSLWGSKESDTTELLNWTELKPQCNAPFPPCLRNLWTYSRKKRKKKSIQRAFVFLLCIFMTSSPGGPVVKNCPANAGDIDSISGSGRSLEGGNGYLLQYSCLENPMDRGAWWATKSMGSLRVGHDWVTGQQFSW